MTGSARVRFVAAGEYYRDAAARLDAEFAESPEFATALAEGRVELDNREAAFQRFLTSLAAANQKLLTDPSTDC